ncbi:hypothetical protein [uncultured Dokdonia sp.]|uniref:hypothetical protein n=1 Tax=uncultured Dokdonia sp. TaxID=575653 RepID=UPI0026102E1C|nr:hypothetical protein [uncultured Dokdonia sp.]
MKKLLIVTMLAVASFANAQIGINTTAPTKTLDVNGELRIRTTPTEGSTPATTLAVDDSGNVVKSNRLSLYEIFTLEAPNSVRVTRPFGTSTVSNINIGMAQTITIPANREAVIKVTYSVPMGAEVEEMPLGTYMGIRFLKNGIEATAGSRKFSLPLQGDAAGHTSQIAKMNTLSALYTEIISATSSDRSFTYTLNGYIEQNEEIDDITYVFNRYAESGANYNWGNANMTVEVYIR